MIAGLEVEMEHCTIENSSNSVALTPIGEALCSVNGSLVEETTKLTQGQLWFFKDKAEFYRNVFPGKV